jgi:hypothetical protein
VILRWSALREEVGGPMTTSFPRQVAYVL